MRDAIIFHLVLFNFIQCVYTHGNNMINVAQDKPCSMSSYHPLTNGSCARAVNGNTGGQFLDNENCVHTDQSDPAPWLQVDLGRVYPVTHITIYARTTFQRRMGNCMVTVDGQVCYKFPEDTSASSREMGVHCSQTLNGSRVRISKHISGTPDWDQTLNICELQVWSCDNDTWGSACDQQCGQCKDGEVCDKVNGYCPQCAPGMQPPLCTEEAMVMSGGKRDDATVPVIGALLCAVAVTLTRGGHQFLYL